MQVRHPTAKQKFEVGLRKVIFVKLYYIYLLKAIIPLSL